MGLLLHRFFNQLVELTGLHVLLKLLVPQLGVILGKPPAKLCQLIGRKPGNGIFDLAERAHTESLPFDETWVNFVLHARALNNTPPVCYNGPFL